MLRHKDNELIRKASYFSVATAAVILVLKAYGWVTTESQSMLASFVDSLLDISSSLINLIAIRYALQPPDHNHRFGHEKFQDLAVFSQAMFFIASSLFTLFSSVKMMFIYHHISNSALGVNIMYLCIILTSCLVGYQAYVVKRTRSTVIEADKLHYFADLLTNITVIISIKLSEDFWFMDQLTGVLISLYIMYGSYKLFRVSIKRLADEEFSDEERHKILQVITRYKQVQGVHDLKTRYAADKAFIQFHIEMDAQMPLLEAHVISDQIAHDLLKIFPGGEIIIHQDPAGIEEKVDYHEAL